MRSVIAVITALLGVVLVLSGAGAAWASALVRPWDGDADPDGGTDRAVDGATALGGGRPTDGALTGRMQRGASVLSKLPHPNQMIIWGMGLLALAAVAAEAITFSFSVSAGAH